MVGRINIERNFVSTKLAEVLLQHKYEGCQAYFKLVRLLDEHLRSNLACSGFLECYVCHRGYRSKQGLKVHMRTSKCAITTVQLGCKLTACIVYRERKFTIHVTR